MWSLLVCIIKMSQLIHVGTSDGFFLNLARFLNKSSGIKVWVMSQVIGMGEMDSDIGKDKQLTISQLGKTRFG